MQNVTYEGLQCAIQLYRILTITTLDAHHFRWCTRCCVCAHSQAQRRPTKRPCQPSHGDCASIHAIISSHGHVSASGRTAAIRPHNGQPVAAVHREGDVREQHRLPVVRLRDAVHGQQRLSSATAATRCAAATPASSSSD